MSFTFKWPRFSDQFHADAIQMLNNALNKGNKPPVIADRIEVVELEMGTQPPELEIRDIGEMTTDQFRGIFRLTYSGDAHIVLRTKVQANPLNHKQPDIHLMSGSRGMLAAKQPLVVPMLLRLSHFKLNSYVVLVVSRQKGITLVFKTDPLQNVDINSTFDSIAVIQKFIQKEIEGQLRQMFREDLPGIIHRLSQQWVKTKVEAPYLGKSPAAPPSTPSQKAGSVVSEPVGPAYKLPLRMPTVGVQPTISSPLGRAPITGYPRPPLSTSLFSSSHVPSSQAPSSSSTSSPASDPPPPLNLPDVGPTSFPEIENFDPTYGLRPEGLPTKSAFANFRNLFAPNKGLADLAEEAGEYEDDGGVDDHNDAQSSYDLNDWPDLRSESGFPPSVSELGDIAEYSETVPAVGGGTITRPRVIYSQSQILSPSGESLPASPRHSARPSLSFFPHLPHLGSSMGARSSASLPNSPYASGGRLPRPLSMTGVSMTTSVSAHGSPMRRPRSLYNPYFAGMTPMYEHAPMSYGHVYGEGEMDPSTSALFHGSSLISPRHPFPSTPPRSRPRSPEPGPSSVRARTRSNTQTATATPFTSAPPPREDKPASTSAPIPLSRSRASSTGAYTSALDRFGYEYGSPTDSSYLSDSHDPTNLKKLDLTLGTGSVSRLNSLSQTNHTLSPYTRTLEHFTVRSVPPRGGGGNASGVYPRERLKSNGSGGQPVKARRKRIFHLGKKPPDKGSVTQAGDDYRRATSEMCESGYGSGGEGEGEGGMVNEFDRYFRSREDGEREVQGNVVGGSGSVGGSLKERDREVLPHRDFPEFAAHVRRRSGRLPL